MKFHKLIATTLAVAFLSLNLSAVIVGSVQTNVILEGESGGLVSDNSKWDSASIKDKVTVMFYVDPDEKDMNNVFSEALKVKNFDRANYASIAMINMAGSWKPNFAIASALESKQEEYPDTLYVKDMNKLLINEWKLQDDSSDILIFAKDSKLLYYKAGLMSEDDIKTAIGIIQDNL